MCGQQEHDYGQACPMNNVMMNKQQQMPQRKVLGPCYTCNGPHLNNSCPQRAGSSGYNQPNRQNLQMQPYRGQNRVQFNYRGGSNFNRGQQNNNSRTYYQSGNPQRGGYNNQYRNNYRGNYRGGYNQNQARNTSQNYQPQNQNRRQLPQDFFKLQKLLESWMTFGQPSLTGQPMNTDHNTNLQTITFTQNDQK